MRAVLIVNPKATTTTASTRDILISSLKSVFELQIEVTSQRGHAQAIARQAAHDNAEYVLTYGGDGTVNEVVNGLMSAHLGLTDLPILGPLPGGSANVFTRALGFSNNPVQAVGQLITGVNDNELKVINLGLATPTVVAGSAHHRYFTFSLGVGLDAEVIEGMELLRKRGKRATPARYLGVTIARFTKTNRREPRITVTAQDGANIYGVFTLIVQNTNPWTFFGPLALSTTQTANFDNGLDFLAIKRMGAIGTLGLVAKLARGGGMQATSDLVSDFDQALDQSHFELKASEPVPLQIDGEFYSRVTALRVESAPRALAVIHSGTR